MTKRVVSENVNGAKSRILEAFSKYAETKPTRHWVCDRRARAEFSSRASVP